MRPLRIGIDYRPALFGRGGISVYVRELVDGLAEAAPGDRLLLFAHRFRRPEEVRVPVLPPGSRLHASRLPWRVQEVLARFGLGSDGLLGGVDVFHSTDYVTVRSTRAPIVATVHDVLFEDLPGCYTVEMVRGLRRTTRTIVRTARRFLVPSVRTARALALHYDVPLDRIDVVPHGVRAPAEVPPPEGPGDYFLFVGTLEPRKNLTRLLAAHARAIEALGPVRLVVAGPRGWMDDLLVPALSRGREVTWLGPVGAERLASLYAGALAVVYPSLGEGFGLPVLEGMAAGKPVLVGAETTCSDLAGDAGVAVDPYDVDAIAEALVRLGSDPALRERLGRAGRLRAASHSWREAGRLTRECYRRAVEG